LTQRRSAALAVAFSLITCAAIPAVASVNDSNTISLTITDAATGTSSTPVPATASGRHYHKKKRASRATVGRIPSSLTSRGMTGAPIQAAQVMGRLGVVASDTAEIRGGRDRYGRVLSTVPKGTNLALAGETDTQYAVLMIDRTYGFVNKADVQLLDYQVVTNGSTASAPGGAATGGSIGAKMVQTAETYMGVPYVWGGETRDGIDCSGFVKAVYSTYGINLPRHSGDQANVGYDVPVNRIDQWVPGDRLYFACHHSEIDSSLGECRNGENHDEI
jgi:cell wall-associated NlpC family hydrolase